MNRKLIRPDLADAKERFQPIPKLYRQRRPAPPEQTNAEGYYFAKQMANHTRMVILLRDGEELRGTIEWYDKSSIKVHRTNEPNILLYKDNIKYMYKENEDKEQEGD
jgi:host factor-I protein